MACFNGKHIGVMMYKGYDLNIFASTSSGHESHPDAIGRASITMIIRVTPITLISQYHSQLSVFFILLFRVCCACPFDTTYSRREESPRQAPSKSLLVAAGI